MFVFGGWGERIGWVGCYDSDNIIMQLNYETNIVNGLGFGIAPNVLGRLFALHVGKLRDV